MILGFLTFVVVIGSAYAILRAYAPAFFEPWYQTLAAAISLGLASFAAAVSFAGMFVSTLLAVALASAGMFTVSVFALARIRRRGGRLFFQEDSAELVWYGSVTLLVGFAIGFLILQSFQTLPDGSVSLASAASVDVPYHLAQITRMAFARYLDFEEPNFSGEFIRYPFFINLLSGVLLKLGAGLGFAYHTPLLLLLCASIVLLLALFRFLGLSRTMATLAVCGVLFGSGLGYVAWLFTPDLAGTSLPVRNGVPYPLQNIAYPGMVPGFLLWQRPFLLGLPLFLITLFGFLRGLRENKPVFFICSGIAVGLLPFAHSHSFIAISIVVATTLIYLFVVRNPVFFDVVRGFVFVSAALSLPQLAALVLLPRFAAGSMVNFRLGWMALPGQIGGINLAHANAARLLPWLRYIGTNFGFLLALPVGAILACAKILRNAKTHLTKQHTFATLALGASALWIVPNLLQFQAWDFDTNKFFAYATLLSLAAAGALFKTGARGRYSALLRTMFVLSIALSLPSSIIASAQLALHAHEKRIVLFTQQERGASQWIREHTDEQAVFLSSAALLDSRTIQNPIVVGAGRKTTIGFTTWLVTHGIDSADRAARVEAFFARPELGLGSGVQHETETSTMPVLADYLIVDNRLRAAYPQLEMQLQGLGYQTVYQNPTVRIVSLVPL